MLWLVAVACGGAGGNGGELPLAPAPVIDLMPSGSGWSGTPVSDGLDDVSNNGFGYTGEIDRYEIEIPSDGRFQIALDWHQEADLDLIVAADPEGLVRVVESAGQGFDPELVKFDVQKGQRFWIFVAGWEGDPGNYTLETLLLPSHLPIFDLLTPLDEGAVLARNEPIVLEFTEELDPDVDIDALVYFVGFGRAAGGHWCIADRRLVFLPHLPISPIDAEVLLEDVDYNLQFPSGPHGPRSIHGEYLGEVTHSTFRFSGWRDFDPSEPPRVTSIEPDPRSEPWLGGAIVVSVSGALDPGTIRAQLSVGGAPLPTRVEFLQEFDCDGVVVARLKIETDAATAQGEVVTLDLPGTILRLGGESGLTGAAPAPAGEGYRTVFVRR